MTIEFSNWDIVRGFFIEIIVVRLLLVYLCASLSLHYLLLFVLILCLLTCLFHSTLHCLTISHFVHLKLPTLLVWLSLSVYSHLSVYLSYYLHMVIRLFIFFHLPLCNLLMQWRFDLLKQKLDSSRVAVVPFLQEKNSEGFSHKMYRLKQSMRRQQQKITGLFQYNFGLVNVQCR